MKKYKIMLRWMAKIELMIAMVGFASTVILNFVEIIQRNLFSDSFPWIQELSLILICWIVFIGSAYVFETQSLINVDFLSSKARGATKLILDLIVYVLMFMVMAVIIALGWGFFKTQNASRTFALSAPRGLYSLPLVICSVSMIFSLINKIYDAFQTYSRARRNGE